MNSYYDAVAKFYGEDGTQEDFMLTLGEFVKSLQVHKDIFLYSLTFVQKVNQEVLLAKQKVEKVLFITLGDFTNALL